MPCVSEKQEGQSVALVLRHRGPLEGFVLRKPGFGCFALNRSGLDQIRVHIAGLQWGGVLCAYEAFRALFASESFWA